ncbi:MAG: hypothetical protein IPM69_09965 [Ignavibacteria bacterium]|nr:hypothetical protein [Ignavibacteria bacterium]
MKPRDKAIRHQQYNGYITEEVVPFIYNDCGGRVPIITTGASLGAFHAVNTVLRRPDIFDGFIGMSGTYDLKMYAGKYYDENCYIIPPWTTCRISTTKHGSASSVRKNTSTSLPDKGITKHRNVRKKWDAS